MGDVVAIWIKRFTSGPMDPVKQAEVIAGEGIVGNADQGGKRQITLLDEAAWRAAEADLGASVPPTARRANVLLRGVDLRESRGRILRIGPVLVRIFGETRPCHLMEEMHAGLQKALEPDWRAGAYGEIVEGGTLRTGDAAAFVEPEPV